MNQAADLGLPRRWLDLADEAAVRPLVARVGEGGWVGEVRAELLQGCVVGRLVEVGAQLHNGLFCAFAGGLGQHLTQLRIGQHKRLYGFHGWWLSLVGEGSAERAAFTLPHSRQMTSSRHGIDDDRAAVLGLSAKAKKYAKTFRYRPHGIDQAEIINGCRRKIALVVHVVGKRFMGDTLSGEHEGNGDALKVVKLEMLRHAIQCLEPLQALAEVIARLCLVGMGRKQQLAVGPSGMLVAHHGGHLMVDGHGAERVLIDRPGELDALGVVLMPDQFLQIEMGKFRRIEIAGTSHRQEQDTHVVAEFLHLVVGGQHTTFDESHVTLGESVEVVSLRRHLQYRIEDVGRNLANLFGGVVAATSDKFACPDRRTGVAHVHQLHANGPVVERKNMFQCAIEDIRGSELPLKLLDVEWFDRSKGMVTKESTKILVAPLYVVAAPADPLGFPFPPSCDIDREIIAVSL